MSLWWCLTCRHLAGSEHGPCPTCGRPTTHAQIRDLQSEQKSEDDILANYRQRLVESDASFRARWGQETYNMNPDLVWGFASGDIRYLLSIIDQRPKAS
jgi:hypothetical protein